MSDKQNAVATNPAFLDTFIKGIDNIEKIDDIDSIFDNLKKSSIDLRKLFNLAGEQEHLKVEINDLSDYTLGFYNLGDGQSLFVRDYIVRLHELQIDVVKYVIKNHNNYWTDDFIDRIVMYMRCPRDIGEVYDDFDAISKIKKTLMGLVNTIC